MKKILFLTLAAATLFSCAKDQLLTQNREAITFENAFVDNATKALDPSITTTSLESFVVYGTIQGDEKNADGQVIAPVVNIFPGVTVSGSSTTSWTYDDNATQYWIAGNTYNFAAVVNGKVAVDANNGMPASIAYDAETQTDLLYATASANGVADSNPKVAFTFDHLLSKVKFTFNNNSASYSNSGYTYKVTNLQVVDAGKDAVYTVSSTWEEPSSKYTANFGNIVSAGTTDDEGAVNIAPQGSYSSNYERLMIPSTKKVTVKCRIALLYGEKEVDVENYKQEISLNLEAGHAYNFVLSARVGEPIEFTVAKVEGWDTTNGEKTL